MKSLIDPSRQQISPEPIKASSDAQPTKTAMPEHLSEFMNFMAGLPTMYKDFEDNGKSVVEGGNPFPDQEDLTAESPYPETTRRQHKVAKGHAVTAEARQIMADINKAGFQPEDKDYLLKLGLRESSFDPTARQGSYEGLYQFNKDSLKTVGMTLDQYRGDVNAQNQAALLYKKHNLGLLRNYFKYIGKQKDGTTITKNGLAAASHLLGAGTVMDYLNGTRTTKLGKKGFVDGLGTHISEYFQLFA